MSESIEKTKEMLVAAKAATEEARKKLAATEEQLDEIDAIHLDLSRTFIKTRGTLDSMAVSNKTMEGYVDQMKKLVGQMGEIEKGVATIEELELRLEAYLRNIHRLDKCGSYTEALQRVDEMLALASSYVFGEEMGIQRITKEVGAWSVAGIRLHQAEARLEKGLFPFEDENGIDTFEEYTSKLPLGIHNKDHIDLYADPILGLRIMDRYLRAKAEGDNYESLSASLKLLESLKDKESIMGKRTKERARFLYVYCLEQFNRLSTDAFDNVRDYGVAKEYFFLREYFQKEEITHEDYREATGENDFHLRFLKKESIKQSEEDFAIAVNAYVDSIASPDEFEAEVLSEYLAEETLEEEKVDRLLAAVARLDFEWLICLFGSALPLGVEKYRQEEILIAIEAKKEREFTLEANAKNLRNFRDLVDESLQKRVLSIVHDILRSPRAHKICVKSTSPDLHALYGEDEKSFRAPQGKPYTGSPKVKAWDFITKGFYFAFGIIFPLLVLLACNQILYLTVQDSKLLPYVLLAPWIASMIWLHVVIVKRHGRDERGSAIWRRVLTIGGIWKGALSLAYFLAPAALSAVKPFAYTLFIFAAVEGLFAFFALKDKKRVVSVLTFVPLLLIEGAALAFLIVGLMNGTI